MRNHGFRLSDMIPNAWFYKLKGMAKKSGKNQNNNNNNSCIKKHQNQNQSCSSLSSSSYSSPKTITTQRKSYYFTRELNCPPPHHHISPEPPRKSSNKRRSAATAASRATTPRNLTSSVSAGSDSPLDSTSYSSEHDSPLPDLLPSAAAAAAAAPDTFDGMLSQCEFDTVSKPSLPPIITKPIKLDESFKRIKSEPNQNKLYRSIVKKNTDNNIVTRNRGNREKQRTCSVLKKTGHSPGLKLRTNSPRIGNRRITQGRKSTSIVGKSFAVVKSSNDPQRDFMESMVEMIVENNIRGSKDLENLLACYLSLNANEYHDLIIEVFKQIWFDITDVRLK